MPNRTNEGRGFMLARRRAFSVFFARWLDNGSGASGFVGAPSLIFRRARADRGRVQPADVRRPARSSIDSCDSSSMTLNETRSFH